MTVSGKVLPRLVLGLMLGGIGTIAPAAAQDVYFHVRTDFLGSDSRSFYTLDKESGNLAVRPWEVADSTFFVRWDAQGFELSRVLIRAERHFYRTDDSGRRWRHSQEEFSAPVGPYQRLVSLGIYVSLPNQDYRPCRFAFGSGGLFLALGSDSLLIVETKRFQDLFPEYGRLLGSPGIRWINLYRGSNFYFVQFQGDCLDMEMNCRQVVVPVPRMALLGARHRLLQIQSARR